ncbi:MAG TPA: phenylalanine--tRNA ligase subunit beta, partial [Gemmatimonadales bacterium]|nr:phenylalanine--tRNA ligase subunit beta [Gemmatimonadales bacterium]
ETYRGAEGQRGRGAGAHGVVGGVTVRIEPGADCARFTGAVIRGVRVGASPDWLRNRLEAVGVRSISNVVDATNYVMLELGQPLHAYDLAKVPGPALIVRRSNPGERIITLDGVERVLPDGTTVIADGAGISGIGGVMGGRGSEVGDATTDVFLESAWWHPAPLRRARRALGLRTEASDRFERGTDLWSVPDALARCIEVVLATAGGALDGDPLDIWPEPAQPPRVYLRLGRVHQILGSDLPAAEVERCLNAIGAVVSPRPEEGRFAVQVPGWRPDLREEVDLIEEIARIHGYESFSDELRPFRAGNQTDAPIERAANLVRTGMVAEGLFEVVLLAVGPEPSGPPDRRTDGLGRQVRIANPISAEHGFLRNSLLPGLTRQVEANWANQVRDVRLFEVGTVFTPGASGESRPTEAIHIGAVITGARRPAHWSDGPTGGTPDCDLWDLKGLFERTVSLANPGAAVQVEGGSGWLARTADGIVAGRAFVLSADAPPWAAPLLGLEVEIDPTPRPAPRYTPVPVFPAATRDLALLVPAGVTVAALDAEVRGRAGELLESVRVIDEYRGRELPAGRRSVAVRLAFRSRERTLRDNEVDEVIERVLKGLERAFDVSARTS